MSACWPWWSLQEVDQRLVLQAENKRLRTKRCTIPDKLQAINRRLQAESDENARLRKALDEARAKLDAVTHIERSINDRGTSEIASHALMSREDSIGETASERLFDCLHHPPVFGLQPTSRDTSTTQKRKARILVVDDDPGLLAPLDHPATGRELRGRGRGERRGRARRLHAIPARPRDHGPAHGPDGRHRPAEGAAEPLAGLKVIILTAHGTIPDAVHATQSGAFGFLTKPVDKQDLLDTCRRRSRCPASRTSTRIGARTSSPATS
jgi:hypothetical protein